MPVLLFDMKKHILILGDILAIASVTIIGFATHGEVGAGRFAASPYILPRMAALFFPLVIAWFALAPFLDLFQDQIIRDARQLWRPAWAGFFAAPLALVPRGFILNAPIIPLFAAILASTFALGMVIWRAIYFLLIRKAS